MDVKFSIVDSAGGRSGHPVKPSSRRPVRAGGAALLLCLCLGCARDNRHAVNVVGSTSIQPFAEMLAQAFHQRFVEEFAEVQGGGSTAGLQAVMEGIADIGTCSRSLKKEEEARGLVATVIARDGLAIVVHPSNPMMDLPREQIRRIFTGQITNWKAVGGEDRPIRPITREEGSGTREAFMKLVMDQTRISRKALTQESNGAVKELVKHDPCAIGYMSLGLVGEALKIITVDGTPAGPDEVKNGTYPLVRPFLFVTRGPPEREAQRFIDFVLSAEAQTMLEREGLIGATSGL